MSANDLAIFLSSALGMFIFILLMLWSSVWKGIALWKAAQRNSVAWFVILLIFNTLGILELIYIFLVAKNKGKCCE